jgi:hypothetical protein
MSRPLDSAPPINLADGDYDIALLRRVANFVEVHNVTIQPGEKKDECVPASKGNVCFTLENNDNHSITLTPTWFSRTADCLDITDNLKAAMCEQAIRDDVQLGINNADPRFFKITHPVTVSPKKPS